MVGVKIERKIPALANRSKVLKYLNVVDRLIGGAKSIRLNLKEIKENMSTCAKSKLVLWYTKGGL
jgi:hypothetical protein